MEHDDWLAEQFDAHRVRLRSVAYRMLGSLSEAEDAVQGTWLRLSRADASGIENLGGWLTTAVARECLDLLRSRRSRRDESLEIRFPDPVVAEASTLDPEYQALVADSVGLAMLVVLETLTPPERVAFVLHDVFAVPHDEIASILGRSPVAARQLASRGRRKVQSETLASDAEPHVQRQIVGAFLAASREGHFEALLSLLHPDVVIRADVGLKVQGSSEVARRALGYAKHFARYARLAVVNGSIGLVAANGPEPVAVMAFTVRDERIAAIDIMADRRRLRALDLPI